MAASSQLGVFPEPKALRMARLVRMQVGSQIISFLPFQVQIRYVIDMFSGLANMPNPESKQQEQFLYLFKIHKNTSHHAR